MAQVLLIGKSGKEVHGTLHPQDSLRLVVGEEEVGPAPVHVEVVEVGEGAAHHQVRHHLQHPGQRW